MNPSSDDHDSRAIQIVRNGIMDDYPDRTVDEAAAGFFETPEWEGFVAEDGLNYVNMEGDATLDGRLVRILLQFVVDVERESFRIYAMTIEGEPQNEETIRMILDTMFGQDPVLGEVVQIRWKFSPRPSLQALPIMG